MYWKYCCDDSDLKPDGRLPRRWSRHLLREPGRVAGQMLAQLDRTVDGEAARQDRAGVDGRIRRLTVHRAELSDRVEVFERQSHWIDHAMTLPARGVFAVLLQPRANRPRRLTGALERGAENVAEGRAGVRRR